MNRTPKEADDFLEKCEQEFNDKFCVEVVETVGNRYLFGPLKVKKILASPEDVRMWMLEKLQDAMYGERKESA